MKLGKLMRKMKPKTTTSMVFCDSAFNAAKGLQSVSRFLSLSLSPRLCPSYSLACKSSVIEE